MNVYLLCMLSKMSNVNSNDMLLEDALHELTDVFHDLETMSRTLQPKKDPAQPKSDDLLATDCEKEIFLNYNEPELEVNQTTELPVLPTSSPVVSGFDISLHRVTNDTQAEVTQGKLQNTTNDYSVPNSKLALSAIRLVSFEIRIAVVLSSTCPRRPVISALCKKRVRVRVKVTC